MRWHWRPPVATAAANRFWRLVAAGGPTVCIGYSLSIFPRDCCPHEVCPPCRIHFLAIIWSISFAKSFPTRIGDLHLSASTSPCLHTTCNFCTGPSRMRWQACDRHDGGSENSQWKYCSLIEVRAARMMAYDYGIVECVQIRWMIGVTQCSQRRKHHENCAECYRHRSTDSIYVLALCRCDWLWQLTSTLYIGTTRVLDAECVVLHFIYF